MEQLSDGCIIGLLGRCSDRVSLQRDTWCCSSSLLAFVGGSERAGIFILFGFHSLLSIHGIFFCFLFFVCFNVLCYVFRWVIYLVVHYGFCVSVFVFPLFSRSLDDPIRFFFFCVVLIVCLISASGSKRCSQVVRIESTSCLGQ